MHHRYIEFGNIVFGIESEVDLKDSKTVVPFLVEEKEADYFIKIRMARLEEETPDSGGYVKYVRDENTISLAVNGSLLSEVTLGQILKMIDVNSLLLEREVVLLHTSYIVHKGRAILFSGPSRIGKSTQAALWKEHRGAEIINGDRAVLFMEQGRLMAGGHFNCGTSGICNNKSVPVVAIVLLQQGMENTVVGIRSLQAFTELMAQIAYKMEVREEVEMATKMVAQVISGTKIFRYVCKKDKSAVEELERYL